MEETEQLLAPSDLRAKNALGKVLLSWNRPEGGRVKTYEIYRGLESGGPYDLMGSVRAPKFIDKVAGGIRYYYVVKAIDALGNESKASNEVLRGALHTVRYQEEACTFKGSWKIQRTWRGTSENFRDSTEPEATASFSFTGSKVTWIAHRDKNLGIGQVYLDNMYIRSVDLFSVGALYQYPVFESVPLKYGSHTIRIVVTGKRNPSSTGVAVPVDAFDVVEE
ncbi:MAG: hypothetical protein QF645_02270 [Planctomycetota bacterium]|jgi:hypothetical protein|nr:hypothetical protein [Planctomycetota bacterium]